MIISFDDAALVPTHKPVNKYSLYLHCALAAAQCIVIGPVCGFVCVFVFVGVFVCGFVTATRLGQLEYFVGSEYSAADVAVPICF